MVECQDASCLSFVPSQNILRTADDILVELFNSPEETSQSPSMKSSAPKPPKKRYLEESRDPVDKKLKADKQVQKNGLEPNSAAIVQLRQHIATHLPAECAAEEQPLNLSLERIYVTSQQKIINHVIEMCMDSLVSSRSDLYSRWTEPRPEPKSHGESPGESRARVDTTSPPFECRVSSTSSSVGSPPNSSSGDAVVEMADSTEDFEVVSTDDGRCAKRKSKKRRFAKQEEKQKTERETKGGGRRRNAARESRNRNNIKISPVSKLQKSDFPPKKKHSNNKAAS